MRANRTLSGLFLTALVAGAPSAARGQAPEVFAEDRRDLIWVGSDVTVLAAAALPSSAADAALAPDGTIFFTSGLSVINRVAPDGTMLDEGWASVLHPSLLAATAEGGVIVGNKTGGEDSIWAVSSTGEADLVAALSPMLPAGLDVPRAGAFEDGIIAIVTTHGVLPATYELWRWSRAEDGSLEPDGTFPLDLRGGGIRRECAARTTSKERRRISVRADGESFLLAQTCAQENVILEHDLDGNRLGTFFEVPPDPTLSDGDDLDGDGTVDDLVSDVLAMPDGGAWVFTERRLYRVHADGTWTRLEHDFRTARYVIPAEWVPFASETATCDASGLGFWKRQCVGEGAATEAPVGPGRRSSAPLRPRLHPDFRDGGLAQLFEGVDRRLERHRVTTCEALWPEERRALRSRVLTRLAALLLDVEDRRLGRRCVVPHQDEPTDVRLAIERIHELIDLDTEESLREAHLLAVHAAQAVPEGE